MAENATAETQIATQQKDQTIQSAPINKNERIYDVKLPDGRTEQWPESKILERAQKSIGLEKRVSDAAKYEQAFNSFVSKVQDPSQLVELLNHPDLKYDEEKQASLLTAVLESGKPKVVEAVKRWLYEKQVKPSMLDPKEREAMEWKAKFEKLESDKHKEEQRRKSIEEEQNTNRIKEFYRQEMAKAFQESGLPIHDDLARQVINKARLFIAHGQQPNWKKCCEMVQQDFISNMKTILGKATVENILNYFDEETPQKINKALLTAVDKKIKEGDVQKGSYSEPSKRKSIGKSKEKTPEEKRKWLRNLERGIIE